jgi:hypothetical protein
MTLMTLMTLAGTRSVTASLRLYSTQAQCSGETALRKRSAHSR